MQSAGALRSILELYRSGGTMKVQSALALKFALGAEALMLAACGDGPARPQFVSPRERCQRAPAPKMGALPPRTVGNGTPESCTAEALQAAISLGGDIRFSCGPEPNGILVSTELRVTKDTRIDGEGQIVLTGAFKSRIFRLDAPGDPVPTLWLKDLTITEGAADGLSHPKDPDAKGGAIRKDRGNLVVENCVLKGHRAAWWAPEASGGALFLAGPGDTVLIDTLLLSNAAANGAGIGVRDSSLRLDKSTVVSNIVFGVGGSPGDGGTGGGIDMRGSGDLLLCESTIWDNYGNSHGGGIYRQGTGSDSMAVYASSIHGNYVLPGHSVTRRGGGIYAESVELAIEASSFYGNGAAAGGGLYAGPGTQLWLLNDTFTQNIVEAGGGAGLLIDDTGAELPTGSIINTTFARNEIISMTGVGAAIFGGRKVSLRNSLFANNRVVARLGGTQCSRPLLDGGRNMQTSSLWEDGSDDMKKAPCAETVRRLEGDLGDFSYHGGPTQTQFVPPHSAAIGQGVDCPATDQRGQKRPRQGCTLGAYEAL